jgi:hypothetical protein
LINYYNLTIQESYGSEMMQARQTELQLLSYTPLINLIFDCHSANLIGLKPDKPISQTSDRFIVHGR